MSRLLNKYRELIAEEREGYNPKALDGLKTEVFHDYKVSSDIIGGIKVYEGKLEPKNAKQPTVRFRTDKNGTTFMFSSGNIEAEGLVTFNRDLVKTLGWTATLSKLSKQFDTE